MPMTYRSSASVALLLCSQLAAGGAFAAAADEPLTQPGYIAGTMKADFQTQRPENRTATTRPRVSPTASPSTSRWASASIAAPCPACPTSSPSTSGG
jgi:hypothetical protein